MALKKIIKEFIALDTREEMRKLRRENPKGWQEYRMHLKAERQKVRDKRIKDSKKGTK